MPSDLKILNFNSNKSVESESIKTYDADSNTKIAPDIIGIFDSPSSPEIRELFINSDKENLNENINPVSITYSENTEKCDDNSSKIENNTNIVYKSLEDLHFMTSTEAEVNISKFGDECTFLNKFKIDKRTVNMQSSLDSFKHIVDDKRSEKNRNTYNVIVDSHLTAGISLKSMQKKCNTNDLIFHDGFAEKISTNSNEVVKQKSLSKTEFSYKIPSSTFIRNVVKTYQCKSPKFLSNKNDQKKSNDKTTIEYQKQVMKINHCNSENSVECNKKSANETNNEDNKKNTNEIFVLLKNFLKKRQRDTENKKELDSETSKTSMNLEKKNDNTTNTTDNFTVAANTKDTQTLQESHKTLGLSDFNCE